MNTLSGILFFVAFLPYIWAILHHQTVPSPVSWAIWASIDALSLIAMRKEKAAIGQLTGAVVGASAVAILALVFGKPSMGSVEWITIAIAALGIILWQVKNDALLGLVCAQIATLVGGVPTIVDGYRNPKQEDPIAWSIWFLSCVCALFAIKKWNLANALQPLVFTTIETAMVVFVVIRPHLL
ncbi:MAG: hypothetical protein ABSE18_01960 [Minisyncoccia bacterium]|jgi:hypothetical protein